MDYSKKTVKKSISDQKTKKSENACHSKIESEKNSTRILNKDALSNIPSSNTNRKKTNERNSRSNSRISRDLNPEKIVKRRKVAQKKHYDPQNIRSKESNNVQARKNSKRKAAAQQESKVLRTSQFRGPAMAPPPKKRRPMAKGLKVIILSLVVILICGTGYCWWLVTGNLNKDLNNAAFLSEYHISDEAASIAKKHKIVNIAIFGIDGRIDEEVEGDRSDAMMIVSADFEHGGIKISSIMRDTFVWITDEDYYDKINASFSLGGAEGAVKTINHNFDTALTDYVTINFDCMIYMVNAVGGVEVTIEDEDVLYWTNQYIGDVNFNCGTNSPTISETGTQTLNGTQALAYCRVRYAGNGDFDRTMRQREVFKQVVLKTLELNPIKQYGLLQQVLPYVKTSLSTNEIMKYALNVMMMKGRTLSQMQVPASDYCEVGFYDGVSYVFPRTLVDSIKVWYRFVYELDYIPSQRAQDLSDEISYIW